MEEHESDSETSTPTPDRPPESLAIFISHSSVDDASVARLRRVLQAAGHVVFTDNTDFDPTIDLPTQILDLLDRSDRVIVLVSEAAAESDWVTREIRHAAGSERIGPQNIIPLLLPGADTVHLRRVFGLEEFADRDTMLKFYPKEPLAIKVEGDPEDPHLGLIVGPLEARLFGRNFDPGEARRWENQPLAELVFEILDPFTDWDGKTRSMARLLFYEPTETPAGAAGDPPPTLATEPFLFEPPLGKIEAADILFYLERYHLTPFGVFTERKERIEAELSRWGRQLYFALKPDDHDAVFSAWESSASHPRRFTIRTPKAPRDPEEPNPQNHPAVTELLALPWELLHDGASYFFKDGKGARVRRFLPSARSLATARTEHLKPPLRVLIICSRPEEEGTDYIDHRVSVRPLVEALESLGDLATWEILSPATLPRLNETLQAALDEDHPYHIVHFDGHGVYDKQGGLGKLVFESPDDDSSFRRRSQLVDAHELGEELSSKGVRLFFLEACQSARSESDPDSSVAGRLLGAGIPSVAAMSHSVLVETARQFTSVFYPSLIQGRRVGSAMLEGQRALSRNRMRGYRWEPREGSNSDGGRKVKRLPLELDDWFVPILFQHRHDLPVLEVSPPPEKIQAELAAHRRLYLGAVPPPPDHSFIGRSRQLLAAERLLIERDCDWILFRGEGGEGKTTIAAELARWLVQSRNDRFPRAAFVSVEFVNALRTILSKWGEQLLPNQFTAQADSEEKAIELLVQILNDQPAVLVLDNLESILPPPVKASEEDAALELLSEDQQALLPQIKAILDQCPGTRLILTSRELPPEESGYRDLGRTLEIGRLGKNEGMELVAHVLAESARTKNQAIDPKALEIEREEEIEHLVDLVQGHARALVLLTPELAERGLQATGDELAEIMEEMDQREGAGRTTSLMASMELSLRRLPPQIREKILPLGVVHGGGSIWTVMDILEISAEECLALYGLLHTVGLAELIPVVEQPSRPSDLFLRFDPALAPALSHELRQSDPNAEREARDRWMETYRQLAGFLYHHQTDDIHLAYQLTRLELPNLLAALERIASKESSPEDVIRFATNLETLLEKLHLSAARVRVTKIREAAAKQIEDAPWSKASFLAHKQAIERCWASAQIREAVILSRDLVSRTAAAGSDAYPDADYDIAMAKSCLGRSLSHSGQVAPALDAFREAQASFEKIAEEEDNKSAAGMASACITEQGDCLRDSGQLKAAAEMYNRAIELDRERGDKRDVATGLGQLATCRLEQREYDEAIRLYMEAKRLFDDLNEPSMVATAWHQIGTVYVRTERYEEAEQAYQESLRIEVNAGNPAGEASTRNQLGALYIRIPDRVEEAVVFLQRAAEIYAELGDARNEGFACNNLAQGLIQLGRHDEARKALLRALELKSQFGPNAQQWTTWSVLSNLEKATNRPEAAEEARRHAITSYADARREGWEITQGAGANLCTTTFQVITRQPETIPQAKMKLLALAGNKDAQPYLKALVQQLIRLLDGVRDESLWQAQDLDFDDAAEILLLLEKLENGEVAPEQEPMTSELPLDPAVFQRIAQDNGLDLATMSPEEKTGFVASVIVQITGRDPEKLTDDEKRMLIQVAARIAETLD